MPCSHAARMSLPALLFAAAIAFFFMASDLNAEFQPPTPSISSGKDSREDISAAQAIESRFLALSASQSIALRFPENFPISTPTALSPQIRETVTPVRASEAPLRPTLLARLMDLPVVAALPPFGHSRFCLRYPADCKVHGVDFRRRNFELTKERLDQLKTVNRNVNKSIIAEVTPGDGTQEDWVVAPASGDCKDYAITKRHELLMRGWPSRSLLLAEVVLPSGEHHLILVIRAKSADLVLDNMADDIVSASRSINDYGWLRIQSPQNPRYWVRVTRPEIQHTVTLSN